MSDYYFRLGKEAGLRASRSSRINVSTESGKAKSREVLSAAGHGNQTNPWQQGRRLAKKKSE